MQYVFPTTYGERCYLVPIDASLVPYISAALNKFQTRYVWASDEDYEAGYNAFAQLQSILVNNCLTELVESNNRIYRLLDSALNGTAYSASGDTPPEISPAIPAAPPAELGAAPGLRRQLLDAQGQLPGGWFGIGAAPATTADLVMAMRAGSEGDIERVTTALDVLTGASSGAVIFNTVRSLLTDTAAVGAEGGILAVLIASTMSQAAMMGLQAGQLDDLIAALNRVVASLDGGADPRPDSNVLAELAGVNEKLV